MTSRERVRRAVHFDGPDHIPHHLPDAGENDILWLWIPGPPDIESWHPHGDHERRTDAWGVVWERMGSSLIGEAVEWPLADITRQQELELPDKNDPANFADARAAVAADNETDNPRYCLGVMPFSSLNEGTHNITGLANMFVAYYEHPDDLKAWLRRLAAAQRESIRRLAEI